MNLIQLRYVKAVASTGSFSMSARLCGVSQPTVSNAISDLESELGLKLFRRSTRCVELTPFGNSVIGQIDSILSLVEDIEQEAEARARPEQKLIRIAFSPVVDGPRLMSMFEPFREGFAGLSFIYKECPVTELEGRLEQDKLDVVCGIRIHELPTLSRCILYWDVLRFLPRGGIENYNGPRTVSLRDVSEETLIFTVDACGLAPATRDLFRRHRLRLREYPGNPLSYLVLEEWSREGIGAALLPESRISADPEAYPILVCDNRPVTIAIEAVWVRTRGAPQHVRDFSAYLKEKSSDCLSVACTTPSNSTTNFKQTSGLIA